jgi:hypothetical protein
MQVAAFFCPYTRLSRRFDVKIALLALAGAAVVLTPITAEARHYSNAVKCTKWRHGKCVAWHRMTRAQARRYAVGHVFGPTYTYTEFSALPHPYVERYHLTPDGRYVRMGNTLYVVDPGSYAVTRVITIP